MQVRGAPLIGAVAAYGMALALRQDASDAALERAYALLIATRPTAINLKWALDEMMAAVRNRPREDRLAAAYRRARGDRRRGRRDQCGDRPARREADRGDRGEEARQDRQRADPLQCRLARDRRLGHRDGADLSGARQGLPIHVWVDETRPRNQGASLTAWELGHHGVAHTVIPDNTGGHLMQHGEVDIAIVGTDRVTAQGDVCNKIGTYLKALAAHDNGVPFYVALPSPTIDFTVLDGVKEIPIEQRGAEEVTTMTGRTADGRIESVRIVPDGSDVANYGFDVTPARLVTGLITERGVIAATRESLAQAFPERAADRVESRGSLRGGPHAQTALVQSIALLLGARRAGRDLSVAPDHAARAGRGRAAATTRSRASSRRR